MNANDILNAMGISSADLDGMKSGDRMNLARDAGVFGKATLAEMSKALGVTVAVLSNYRDENNLPKAPRGRAASGSEVQAVVTVDEDYRVVTLSDGTALEVPSGHVAIVAPEVIGKALMLIYQAGVKEGAAGQNKRVEELEAHLAKFSKLRSLVEGLEAKLPAKQ